MQLADALFLVFVSERDLQTTLKDTVPINMLSESFSLYDGITEAKVFTKQMLMIDLKYVKNACKLKCIDIIFFIQSENKLVDALKKSKASPILSNSLRSGKINHSMEQWIQIMPPACTVDKKIANVKLLT